MKKIFTLIFVALCTSGVYAQESWSVANEDGTLKEAYSTLGADGEASIVEFSTDNVKGMHVSGPVSGYTDSSDLPLEATYDNSWGNLNTKALSSDGSVAPFYYVQGKGNPVNIDLVAFEEIVTDDVGTGVYRANWTESYYKPDGTAGLPGNGTYVTLTPSVAGTMVVAAWINKGYREVFIVKGSDAKALSFTEGEVVASGYVNGTNNDVAEGDVLYGYPLYQESIDVKALPTDSTYAEYYDYVIGYGNQAGWYYFTFAAEAGETYYVFNKSTQIGFSGFTFTPSEEAGDSNGSTDSDLYVDSWYVNEDDGTLKSIYVANEDASQMSVVEFSTDWVSGTHTSGPVSGYSDGSDLPLEAKYDNSWGGIKSQALSADGSVAPFYYVQGKGNPVNLDLVSYEEIVTDGVGTGVYRALWTDSYYSPDGTNGLPTNGTYVTLTPKADGEFTVAAWVNKGRREVFIVKASDMCALSFTEGEVTISGYINGTTGDDGYLLYQESIDVEALPTDSGYVAYYDYAIAGTQNNAAFAYFTFDAVGGETYYVFNKSTQIGFSGFTFTTDGTTTGTTGITEVVTSTVNDPDAPVYNLAGQRVSATTKGILIKNGKKFINR